METLIFTILAVLVGKVLAGLSFGGLLFLAAFVAVFASLCVNRFKLFEETRRIK